MLQPSRQVWRGGQVSWRGAKPPGATRAVTWPQAAFGIYSRCFLHCFAHGHRRRKPSAPGAFWTVLLMEQVAKATCILCKKLQRTRGGTWRFPRVSRAKSGILWLSGGTTRFRWCGASYLGPSMRLLPCACRCALWGGVHGIRAVYASYTRSPRYPTHFSGRTGTR